MSAPTSRLTSFAAGALCMLVLGSGSAVAATGGKLLLGRSNTATATTTLASTKGTALSLRAPAGKPPLTVSSGARVPNLNADRVDGLSSADLARTKGRTATVTRTGTALDTDHNGKVDTVLAEADCPSGSLATGGGHLDLTASGYTVQAEPLPSPEQGFLVVVAVDEAVSEDVGNVAATAVCYSPTGAVAVGRAPVRRLGLEDLPPRLRRALSVTAGSPAR